MITARDLRKPSGVQAGTCVVIPADLREAIRSFPGRDLLSALTPFSTEVLDRLATGEPIRMSGQMWLSLYVLVTIVGSRRVLLEAA